MPARRMPATKKRRAPKARLPQVRPRYVKHRNVIHNRSFRIQDTQVPAKIYNLNTGTPTGLWNHISWSLNMFPHSKCFTDMYNQYRISKIKVQFIPVNTRAQMTQQGVGADSNVPTFSYFINRTTTEYPQNLGQVLSVPGAKQTNAGKYATAYFSPVTFDSVYRAGATATNALNPEYGQWIRTTEADVRHHGLSWVMSAAGSNWPSKSFEYRTVVTIYAQFKGYKIDDTV